MIDLQDAPPEKIDETHDLKGLHCPLPILKTKAALSKLDIGQVIHVIASDPLAPLDFKSYSVHAPHVLLFMTEDKENNVFEFFIRKGE